MSPVVPPRVQTSYDPQAHGALCAYCPLRGKPFVPPKGPPDPEIVLVGETPGYNEEQRGEPFSGPSGKELDSILYYLRNNHGVQAHRQRLWFTNTILCRPETPDVEGTKRFDFSTYLAWIRKQNAERRKAAYVGWKKGTPAPTWNPIASPVECCAPRLWSELTYFEHMAHQRGDANGIVVMPLGNYAMEAITGKAGIMKHRGTPIPIDIRDPLKPQGGEPT